MDNQFAKSISVLNAINWIALACDSVKPECVQNYLRKGVFLSNEGTNIDLPENALKKINEECLTANVDIEYFITFDSKLETHQTYDSATFLEEKKFKIIENDDEDSETSD